MTGVRAAGVSRLVMGWDIWGRGVGGTGHLGEAKRGTQGVDLGGRRGGNLGDWVSEGGERGPGAREVMRGYSMGGLGLRIRGNWGE